MSISTRLFHIMKRSIRGGGTGRLAFTIIEISKKEKTYWKTAPGIIISRCNHRQRRRDATTTATTLVTATETVETVKATATRRRHEENGAIICHQAPSCTAMCRNKNLSVVMSFCTSAPVHVNDLQTEHRHMTSVLVCVCRGYSNSKAQPSIRSLACTR